MAKRHVPSAWRRTTSMASPVLSIGFPSRPFADMCQSLYTKARSSPASMTRTTLFRSLGWIATKRVMTPRMAACPVATPPSC